MNEIPLFLYGNDELNLKDCLPYYLNHERKEISTVKLRRNGLLIAVAFVLGKFNRCL